MSTTLSSFRSGSTYCSFYKSQKKQHKNYQTEISYLNCLKQEIERHYEGAELLADEKIILHLKNLKNFKRHRNVVSELKRSLNLIYNQNKKFERMLSTADLQNGNLLLISNGTNQKEILPLLKPLIDDSSGQSSVSFPSDLLSNKNFVDSDTMATDVKACSNVVCDTNDDTITNTPDNYMDIDHNSGTDSDETLIPNDSLESNMDQLEQSSYESSNVVFNTDMLSNANFIVQSSESFQSDGDQQVVPNGQNLSNLEHIEKKNASSQILPINQCPSYKKVFIFDSNSGIWKQSEHSMIDSSANVDADSQRYNAVTPNVLPEQEHGIFKKPSNISIKRKISSRTPSRKTFSEDGQKKIISASYSTVEHFSHSDRPVGRQKEIISDTFDKSLQTDNQNVALKISTLSIQDSIINGTYSATENGSRTVCQKGVQSTEKARAKQCFVEKEIISDSFNTSHLRETPEHRNYGDFKTEMESKNTNGTPSKPTMSSDAGVLKKDNSLEYGKSQSLSQSRKPDNYSITAINELSWLFEQVMTLKQHHNENNIYKKMLTDVEDFAPTRDPKTTLDLARKLSMLSQYTI
nr:unnamed protein product [Callosobruchus chinensis]